MRRTLTTPRQARGRPSRASLCNARESFHPRGRVRRRAFSYRLFALSFFATAKRFLSCHYAAWPPRLTRSETALSNVRPSARGVDFGRPAPAALLGELAGNGTPRFTGGSLSSAQWTRQLPGISRTRSGREAPGPSYWDCQANRHAA